MKKRRWLFIIAMSLTLTLFLPSCAELLKALEATETNDNTNNNTNKDTDNNTNSNTSKGKK